MNTKNGVSLDDIKKAMQVWRETPLLGPNHHEVIDRLIIASDVSREHFDATARWLFSDYANLMIEAMTVATRFGMLRDWDALRT